MSYCHHHNIMEPELVEEGNNETTPNNNILKRKEIKKRGQKLGEKQKQLLVLQARRLGIWWCMNAEVLTIFVPK